MVPVVDLRGESADRPPVPGSLVVSPPSSWQDFSMELPPRGVYFRVLYDPDSPESAGPAAAFVAQFTPWALATRSDDGAFWLDVSSAGASARMWRPGPLAEVLAARLPEWLGDSESAHPPPPAPLRVLDVGSGTGRNAVFLALEAGCACTCVDNRRVLVDKCARFAARAGAGAGGATGGGGVVAVCAEAEAWLAARLAAVCSGGPPAASGTDAGEGEQQPGAEASGDAVAAALAPGAVARAVPESPSSPQHPADPPSASSPLRRGRLRLPGDEAAAAASATADARPFDALLFARFTHKPALRLAARLMEAQVRGGACEDGSEPTGERGGHWTNAGSSTPPLLHASPASSHRCARPPPPAAAAFLPWSPSTPPRRTRPAASRRSPRGSCSPWSLTLQQGPRQVPRQLLLLVLPLPCGGRPCSRTGRTARTGGRSSRSCCAAAPPLQLQPLQQQPLLVGLGGARLPLSKKDSTRRIPPLRIELESIELVSCFASVVTNLALQVWLPVVAGVLL